MRSEDCITKIDLAYDAYKQLCLQSSIEPVNPAIFGKLLFDLFPFCEKKRRRVPGKADKFEYPFCTVYLIEQYHVL